MKFRAGDLVVNRFSGTVRVVSSVSNVLNGIWVKPQTSGYGKDIVGPCDPDRWEIA